MSRYALLLVPAAVVVGALFGYFARGGAEPVEERAPEIESESEDRVAALTVRVRELELMNADLQARLAEKAQAKAPPSKTVAPDPEDEAPVSDEERQAALAELPDIEYHLSANPTDRDLLRQLVQTAARAGAHDRALALLAKLAKEHPDSPDIKVQTGRALLYKISSVEVPMEKGALAFKAVEQFGKALEIDDNHFDARLARAVSLYHFPTFLSKLDQSIADFEVLVTREGGRGDDDRYAHAYAGLSAAYRKAGRPEDAKKALEKGLTVFPGHAALTR